LESAKIRQVHKQTPTPARAILWNSTEARIAENATTGIRMHVYVSQRYDKCQRTMAAKKKTAIVF